MHTQSICDFPKEYSDVPDITEAPRLPNQTSMKTWIPKKLDCESLSKKLCTNEYNSARCEYDAKNQICLPRATYGVSYFRSKERWRNGVISWLSNPDCNIDSISNLKVFVKDSASSSIIMTGTVRPTAIDRRHSNDNNIVLKITFQNIYDWFNGLNVEIAIYKNVISQLINNRNTPHLTAYLGFTSCYGNLKLSKAEKLIYNSQVDLINSEEYDLNRHFILFTERSEGKYLKDWFTGSTTLYDLLSVIFQVLYTLQCFVRIGLQHNDLHFQNIFVEDIGRVISLYYKKSNNQYIELKTRYLVKIYDWDRGSILHPAVPSNLQIIAYNCKVYGMCDRYNPKFDLFFFFSSCQILFFSPEYPERKAHLNIEPFTPQEIVHVNKIADEIKQKWLFNVINWPWFMKAQSENRHRLRYLEIPTDAQLKSPKDALTELLNAKWTDSPFIIHSGDGSDVPKEIFFTPPANQILKRDNDWIPETKHTHPSIDPSYFDSDDEDDVDYDKYDDIYENDEYDEPNIIQSVWIDELKQEGIGVMTLASKLYDSFKQKWGESSSDLFQKVCVWLCCYQFHRLTLGQQHSLLQTKKLRHAFDTVWNTFNNRFPITIPRFIMVPEN